MDYDRIEQLANEVAQDHDARVLLYSGGVDQVGFGKLVDALQETEETPHKTNTVLILTTDGGLADAAYQIARLLQNASEKFILCIPTRCKSAGTLIALGAHQILMSPIAEFGPLDVQLIQKDEIGERRSGLVVRTALSGLADETFDVFSKTMLNIKHASGRAVSFEVAARIASEIAIGVMAPVYAQISPEALGTDLRDLHVATAYGQRLAAISQNTKPDCVRRLVEDYPTHGFIIDMNETASLFERVDPVGGALHELIIELGPVVYAQPSEHCVFRLDKQTKENLDGLESDEVRDDGAVTGVASGRSSQGTSDSGTSKARRTRKSASSDSDAEK